ncbi:hypothetical protein [Mesorhizobium sp. Z1-4]|uniref:hypothetical protein n=1 Tax=Mesorhizobium sp. Z1-4 TaxID=2448478 RepID=UPI001FE0F71A|nr:hypothetical protein [Mesorhizobium sp. Z1-4]
MILRDGREHSPTSRKARECFCKPTLREIGRANGEDHLKLVLMLMTGEDHNARELYADMIKAVSGVLASQPDLVRRPALIDEFNAIDLASLRRAARTFNLSMARSDALKVLLMIMLYPSWREAE